MSNAFTHSNKQYIRRWDDPRNCNGEGTRHKWHTALRAVGPESKFSSTSTPIPLLLSLFPAPCSLPPLPFYSHPDLCSLSCHHRTGLRTGVNFAVFQ